MWIMDLGYSRPTPIFIIPTTKFVSKKDYHLYQCIKQEINIPSGEQEQGGMPMMVGWLKWSNFGD